ncbi:MAG TPA: YibE/F family protein [Candidatus Limnocylindria bacterium]
MTPLRLALCALAALAFAACAPSSQNSDTEIVSGHVADVVQIGQHVAPNGASAPFQELRVQLDDSLYRGDVVELEWDGKHGLDANAYLKTGDRVLMSVSRQGNDRSYTIQEVVRLPSLIPIAVVLVLALLVIARLRGLTALAGLVLSVTIFLLAVVPAIRTGGDPLVSTLLGSVAASALTVFVVHGVSRRSLLAIGGTFAGLGIATAAGAAAIAATRLSGVGTDEQVALALSASGGVDMPRLALAGMMVGSLGAIVDMSLGQVWTTLRLARADDMLRGRRLFLAAVDAARDHLASLVNTLALAYFGASLPTVLLVWLGTTPSDIALNSEPIAAVLGAVIAASLGVIATVPVTAAITTLFAGAAEPAPFED